MTTLPATLRLGPVHLTVRDLDRAVAWYQRSLGLRVHRHEADVAELGDGADTTVVLHEDPQALPAGRHAGLYHYALLYPSREELARAVVRLGVTRTPIEGASDHETHEAIYLPDADGNGIELAADRPREQWPDHLGYAGGPKPLDVDDLLATVHGEDYPEQVGPGLRMGHLHLHVGDIEQGLGFYRDRSASSSRRRSATRPRSCPPAATTTTSASTPGAAKASRPRPTTAPACAAGPSSCRRPPTSRPCASGSTTPSRSRRLPHARPVGQRRGYRRGLSYSPHRSCLPHTSSCSSRSPSPVSCPRQPTACAPFPPTPHLLAQQRAGAPPHPPCTRTPQSGRACSPVERGRSRPPRLALRSFARA